MLADTAIEERQVDDPFGEQLEAQVDVVRKASSFIIKAQFDDG